MSCFARQATAQTIDARQIRFVYRRVRSDAIRFRGVVFLYRPVAKINTLINSWVRVTMFHRRAISVLCCLALTALPVAGAAQQNATQQIVWTYAYADVADFALASSVVAHVKIRKAQRLKGALAAGVAAGRFRYLITADMIALIRAPSALAKRLSYLIDIRTDSAGRPATRMKGEVIVFALPGRPGELRLIAPDAQISYSPELAQTARAIMVEAARPDAPPKVTGVGTAFHAPGNLTGEGETQIFLEAEGNRPVSLNIRRRTGAAPRWFPSADDMVDESAAPPRRNTLLWYRLACFLPPTLPASALADIDPAQTGNVTADYSLVISGLGACQRLWTR